MAERKFYMTTWTLVSTSATQHVMNLTQVPFGMSNNQRIGSRCLGTSIELRWFINNPSLNGTLVSQLAWNARFVLFFYNDDTIPTYTSLFEGYPAPSVLQNTLLPLGSDFKSKRKVLAQWTSNNWGETTTAGALNYYNTVFKPTISGELVVNLTLRKFSRGYKWNQVDFHGNTVNGQNHIYLMILPSDFNSAATFLGRNMYVTARYNFVDM